jgi:phosphatidylserine decarboxylase
VSKINKCDRIYVVSRFHCRFFFLSENSKTVILCSTFFYVSLCDVDLEEAALPLENYETLQEFFVRKLKEGSRPIDADPNCLVTGNHKLYLIFIFNKGNEIKLSLLFEYHFS